MCFGKKSKSMPVENSVEIKVYGTTWCGDCRRARAVFDRMAVPYAFIDLDRDKAGETFVKQTNRGSRSVPTIVFPDGSILVEPSNAKLEEKLAGYQVQD